MLNNYISETINVNKIKVSEIIILIPPFSFLRSIFAFTYINLLLRYIDAENLSEKRKKINSSIHICFRRRKRKSSVHCNIKLIKRRGIWIVCYICHYMISFIIAIVNCLSIAAETTARE